jgi:biotin carboxylase
MVRTSSRHHRWVARVLLLVPSTTYRAADFIEAARALGVDVVIGTDREHALPSVPGARTVALSYRDLDGAVQAIVAQDAASPLDAVVAVDDVGTVVAAQASAALGLPHNPPDAVAAARHKLKMRARLAASEVAQPRYASLPAGAGPDDVTRICAEVGYPCVIKPTTLSASQGVLRADDADEARAAAARVRSIASAAGVDDADPLLVERFVSGTEVALEGLVISGALQVLAIFDKPDPLEGPAFEETIYVTPTRLSAADVAAVHATATAAVFALGLRDGPVHAEVRVHDGRAQVIEVAARTIGGLCSRALSFSTGRTLEEIVIRHALGMTPGPTAAEGASGVLMIPVPRAGTLQGVGGQAEARAVPGVTGLEITVAAGHRVAPAPDGDRYLGFVFARDATPARVERALRRAGASLDVRVDGADGRARSG